MKKIPKIDFKNLKKLCYESHELDIDDPLTIRFIALHEIIEKINLRPFVPERGMDVWLLNDKIYKVASISDLNKNKIFIRTRFIRRLRNGDYL